MSNNVKFADTLLTNNRVKLDDKTVITRIMGSVQCNIVTRQTELEQRSAVSAHETLAD